LICLLIVPFLPESPRWLIHQNRHEEALEVIALTDANGNRADQLVLVQYQAIIDTIAFEKNNGETLSPMTMVKTKSNRRRMMLASSVAVCAILSGGQLPVLRRNRKYHGHI